MATTKKKITKRSGDGKSKTNDDQEHDGDSKRGSNGDYDNDDDYATSQPHQASVSSRPSIKKSGSSKTKKMTKGGSSSSSTSTKRLSDGNTKDVPLPTNHPPPLMKTQPTEGSSLSSTEVIVLQSSRTHQGIVDVDVDDDDDDDDLAHDKKIHDHTKDGDDNIPLRKNCFGQIMVPPAVDAMELDGSAEKVSKYVARNPCLVLLTSLIVGTALSAIALIVGQFSVSAETGGWNSRGTMISNRQTQLMLVMGYQEYLFSGGDAAWVDLETNVQPGWESDDDDDDDATSKQDDTTTGTRRLDSDRMSSIHSRNTQNGMQFPPNSLVDYFHPKMTSMEKTGLYQQPRLIPFVMSPEMDRRLQDVATAANNNTTSSSSNTSSSGIANCDTSFYKAANMTQESRLWPIWKITSTIPDTDSILDSQILHDVCVAEQNTQRQLEELGLCFGCPDDRCLPPYSVVLYARLVVPDGFDLDCTELADSWGPYQKETETTWKECIEIVKDTYDPNENTLPEACPFGFYPSVVQANFHETMISTYSSSIFATHESQVDELYDAVGAFDRGSDIVIGVYDTQDEDFVGMYTDESLGRDMALALGSAVVVTVAIMIHTRSFLITIIGLVQIILSFPLSYFVYKLIAGLDFFPFLNFIGIFVVFSLGAGDIFVAIDKWKNARLQYPTHSTEYVAAKAFPDTAWAMFLTTLTTAVAFFSTAVCPVAPIKMFAIFCGLLVTFDYIMNVLMVFPALCIYDKTVQAKKRGHVSNRCWMFCVSCTCCGLCTPKIELDDLEQAIDGNGMTASKFIRTKSGELEFEQEEEIATATSKASNIQRAMLGFYYYLHMVRWPLFVVCAAALGVCIWKASTLSLPKSSDVRLLGGSVQFEQNWAWRQQLLSSELDKLGGSQAAVIWGVIPSDTGDQNNPASWSQLVLDQSFNLSSEEAQQYVLDFCDDLFAQEFASPVDDTFVCPMKRFDDWLSEQVALSNPDEGYAKFCAGATGIPVPENVFDACISYWASSVAETSILSKDGVVKIMFIPFNSRVRYDAPYDILDDEWNLIEDWMTNKNQDAPEGVQDAYFSSEDFWWYDTNGNMLSTAYSSAAITLLASAAVILFSSRSIVMTIFATITIGYILTSVTAMLVAIGWTLGFLESICFAILIGVSVDFVIHFSHAYAHKVGNVSRGDRTKYAVLKMGPSILATAVTTILSAVVMLFTIISFFEKFALILFFTVLQATLGSFIVFLTLTDCIGPENPTYVVDKCVALCWRTNGALKKSRSGTDG